MALTTDQRAELDNRATLDKLPAGVRGTLTAWLRYAGPGPEDRQAIEDVLRKPSDSLRAVPPPPATGSGAAGLGKPADVATWAVQHEPAGRARGRGRHPAAPGVLRRSRGPRAARLRRLDEAQLAEFQQADAQAQENNRTWSAWQEAVRVAVLAGDQPPPRPAMPEPQPYSMNYALETARLRDELERIGRRISARVLPDVERELAEARDAVRPLVAALHAAVPDIDRLTALVDVCRRAAGEAVEPRRPVTAADLC